MKWQIHIFLTGVICPTSGGSMISRRFTLFVVSSLLIIRRSWEAALCSVGWSVEVLTMSSKNTVVIPRSFESSKSWTFVLRFYYYFQEQKPGCVWWSSVSEQRGLSSWRQGLIRISSVVGIDSPGSGSRLVTVNISYFNLPTCWSLGLLEPAVATAKATAALLVLDLKSKTGGS